MAKNDGMTAYGNFIKNWPKQAGTKITEDLLRHVEELGLRTGRKATMAAAMYLRKEGATTGQVSMIVGGPQLNVRRTLIQRGLVQDVPMVDNEAGHKVYKIALVVKKAVKKTAKKRPAKRREEPASQEPAQPGIPATQMNPQNNDGKNNRSGSQA